MACYELENISLPSNLKEISENAFSYCAIKTLNLPDGLEKVYDRAFSYCTLLQTVKIPGSVTQLGGDNGEVQNGGVTYFYTGVFANCKALENVTWKTGERNTTLGSATFKGCTSLTSISIPGNCVEVGEYAFSECSALQKVRYRKGTRAYAQKIQAYAFSQCPNLYDLYLTESISFIGDNIFYGSPMAAINGAKGSVAETYADENYIMFSEYKPEALNVYFKASRWTAEPGDVIELTATGVGGEEDYTYKYLVHNKDTNQWSYITPEYTENNVYRWKAGSDGNREFFVEVKDAAGTVVRSSVVNVTVATKNPLTISAKSSATSVTKGSKVTISGTASGGKGGYTYNYLVHNKDTNAWSRLTSSFTTSNTYTWTAGSTGNREFFVEVKDSAGKVVRSSAVNVSVK